jgi:hypothetical protein
MIDLEFVEETRKLARCLDLGIPENTIDQILNYWLIADSHGKKEIEDTLGQIFMPHLQKMLNSKRPVLAPPSTDALDDLDLNLGDVVSGDRIRARWGLKCSELTKHMILCSRTGGGKSTVTRIIVREILKVRSLSPTKEPNLLYFDVKDDGLPLVKDFPGLIYLHWKNFRFNPLRPPLGMERKDWWTLFAEACGFNFKIYLPGMNFILEYLDELSDKHSDKPPTMKDFYDLMISHHEVTPKRVEYFSVMFNRIRTLISILGRNLDCQVGLPLESLISKPVILSLSRLRAAEQEWLITVILTWVYAYHLVQKRRGEDRLRLLVICDECHRIWGSHLETSQVSEEMGMPILSLFPTQFRDFGVGLVGTTNMPALISQSFWSNSAIKATSNLSSGYDVWKTSEALGLDDAQTEAIYKLKHGEWIIRTPQHPEPFMVVTPDYPVDWNVDEAMVENRLLENFPELYTSEPASLDSRQETYEYPSNNGRELLLHVAKFPLKGISTRYAELNFGIHGKAIKEELVTKGLVRETELPLGANRPTKFLLPTEKGLQFLKDNGENARKWQYWGNQGFEHRLLASIVYYIFLNSGFQTTREVALDSGKRVDVFAMANERRIGVEIEMDSNADIWGFLKAQKDLDELQILCRDSDVLRNIESSLQNVAYPQVMNKIKLFTISQYLKSHRNILFQNLENYPSSNSNPNSEA